ncbi:hypothetical protein [Sediminivirga luteola]|uniref:Uncharacterized protein n=1 Tax=Sediminivirga luteola TaxID=1774748 RepID=A0A8J2TX22_9MICO|nr:hypothetical protein [Sediminivirga luteola]GGA10822.1 hypothetical protein GCM10011333_12050 [Sediminivirga luteola]
MSDATDYLDQVQARADAATRHCPDAPYLLDVEYVCDMCSGGEDEDEVEWPCAFWRETREDVPRLVAALRAVLEAHSSIGGRGVECDVCADERGPKPYPCPTVWAITEALEGD